MEDKTQRTLGALFKFSDDEDDDEIPGTIPNGRANQIKDNERAEATSTQKLDPSADVDFIPGTPDESDEEVVDEFPGLSLVSGPKPSTKRKMDHEDISMLPTAKIPTLAQLPTMPISEPSTSRRTRGSPRKEASQSKSGAKQTNLSQWLQQGEKRKTSSDEAKVECMKKIKTEPVKEEDEVPKKLKEVRSFQRIYFFKERFTQL